MTGDRCHLGLQRTEHIEVIASVVGEMRRQMSRALSLGDLADMARMSPFHFLRVFRAQTGITPRDFMAAIRMEEAKRLLLTTSLSVAGSSTSIATA